MGESKPGFQSKLKSVLELLFSPKSILCGLMDCSMPGYSVIQWLSAVIIESLLESMCSSIDQEDWRRLSVLLLSIKLSESL